MTMRWILAASFVATSSTLTQAFSVTDTNLHRKHLQHTNTEASLVRLDLTKKDTGDDGDDSMAATEISRRGFAQWIGAAAFGSIVSSTSSSSAEATEILPTCKSGQVRSASFLSVLALFLVLPCRHSMVFSFQYLEDFSQLVLQILFMKSHHI